MVQPLVRRAEAGPVAAGDVVCRPIARRSQLRSRRIRVRSKPSCSTRRAEIGRVSPHRPSPLQGQGGEYIVDGECSSSCGNYLAPLGHRKLHVTEGSFISLHGVPARGLFDYIDARRKAAGKTVEELMSDTETFFAYQRAYPDHVRDVLIPEVQYFADVNKDEATRPVRRMMRTLSMRPARAGRRRPTLRVVARVDGAVRVTSTVVVGDAAAP